MNNVLKVLRNIFPSKQGASHCNEQEKVQVSKLMYNNTN